MGIINIHLLTQPDDRAFRLKEAALKEALIEAHRRDEHVYGRQGCPLCQTKN